MTESFGPKLNFAWAQADFWNCMIAICIPLKSISYNMIGIIYKVPFLSASIFWEQLSTAPILLWWLIKYDITRCFVVFRFLVDVYTPNLFKPCSVLNIYSINAFFKIFKLRRILRFSFKMHSKIKHESKTYHFDPLEVQMWINLKSF